MNRFVPMLVAVGLAAALTGCQSTTDSEVAVAPGDAAQFPGSDYTLVSLKVPNMT
jgi:hypothetical protein